jgi:transcription elongation factor GreA
VLVDEQAADDGTIVVGSRVELEDEQGGRLDVEISSVGGVSPDSPVGRALMGAKAGDEVEIDAPSGSWRARVISVGR